MMMGFEIRMTENGKGKGLFATKSYKQGDTILEEEPMASCQFAWNKAAKYLACDHCMWPLETPEQNVRRLSNKPDLVLPYPDCYDVKLDQVVHCSQCGSIYCSETCRQKAYASYHQTLCYDENEPNHPITILIEYWKQMHYPPETMNIMLLLRILASIKQSNNPGETANAFKQFCHRTVNEDQELVHHLLGEKFASQLNSLRELMLSCISGDYVQEFLTPDGFYKFLALIGTNGQGVGTSPLAMWSHTVAALNTSKEEKQQLDEYITKMYEFVESASDIFLNTEGSGLYRLQSAANHSCVPNAQCTFPLNNHTLVLVASKDINPGDEISICYMEDSVMRRSRHTRQKELAKNYLFLCQCELCLAQSFQPDCTSEEDEDTESEMDED